MNSLSPILLSPSSTTITNHISLFDNSDQGSVDSDYTSLGSSKFYGNSGSTSSLHHQGRSQSIDELATTTTIPTRHFNGISNHNKCNNDPLQFVKIHPNHDLIERAQEQLSIAESRQRLQENYKLKTKISDEENDWSKVRREYYLTLLLAINSCLYKRLKKEESDSFFFFEKQIFSCGDRSKNCINITRLISFGTIKVRMKRLAYILRSLYVHNTSLS
jgi:hypothetical protein